MKSSGATETQRKKLTVSNESVFSALRHCEERLCGDSAVNKVMTLLNVNKQRGNLPSLIKISEIFTALKETSFLQIQCEEIASRIQQHEPSLLFIHYIRRLAMATQWSEATSERFMASTISS